MYMCVYVYCVLDMLCFMGEHVMWVTICVVICVSVCVCVCVGYATFYG